MTFAMKIFFIPAFLLGAILCSCERSADQMNLSSDLKRDLLALKQDYELTDKEVAGHLREWIGTAVSMESLVDREDLWGPDGLSEGDIEEMVRKMAGTVYDMQVMQMFGETVVLEYLVKEDVQGAEEHLRSNIAVLYKRHSAQSNSDRTDRLFDRVNELARMDPKLKALLDSSAHGEQGDDAN